MIERIAARAPRLGIILGSGLGAVADALDDAETISYAELARRLGCSPNSIGPIRARCFKERRDALADG
jgi:hypothetical protein